MVSYVECYKGGRKMRISIFIGFNNIEVMGVLVRVFLGILE